MTNPGLLLQACTHWGLGFIMKNSISKPVLAILATGILLTGAVLWFGLHPRKTAAPENLPAVAETSKPIPVPAPKTIPSPAKPLVAGADNNFLAVIPISLTNIIDDADSTWFRNDAAAKTLPTGTQVYGGIEFWLQGAIHLQGLATRDDQHQKFRTNITVPLDETNFADGKISVSERGKNIASIYFLGGTRFSTPAGEKFADVLWHYADGTASRSGIQYNIHLRDWWRSPYEDPARLPNELTKVAWQGPHPTRKTGSIRLYRVALINPHPEKIIRSLEFVSAMARPSLFVVALTLDPLMPGARPDNLTSEEMADPELNGQLQLFVQDSQGHPLVGAKVSVDSRSKIGSISPKFTTDASGMALVRYPDTGLQTLDVNAEHDDFSGRKMRWDVSAGDTVPANYTLKLASEVKIGGIVLDPENNPISGATIRLYRFWSGNDGNPDKKGEQANFTTQQQTTDADGHWQAKGLPQELIDHIGFEISHPDYVGTAANVGDNGSNEKQLREGTYKTILKRGQDVSGRVVDDAGNPVSGATVWAGRKYTRERKQATSDSGGQFSFHSVEIGDVQFSVMAKNHSPDSKMISVKPDMAEIIFRLKAGSVIRGHVQDESGQPVASARVNLEGNYGELAYDAYEFNANTDSNGDFSWDGAPAEEMPFYISHDGFEAKRGVKLAPNQDNTITMHKSRQLEGVVLDATTEQPVTKFTVRTGHTSGDNDSNVYGVIRYKDFSAADGRFTLTLEEEDDNAVLVMADGYADKVEKFPDAQNGSVQIIVKLKPAATLSGVVLGPDGTPAPGVTVAASDGSSSHGYVSLTGGRLRSYDAQSKMATTDDQGRFKLGSVPDDGLVVAAGDPGFARAPLAEVRNSGTITLQAWGRIEGTLKIGGQPGVGKELLFNLNIPGIGTDFNGYKSTVDDQGQFTMEKIPPGEGAIVRLIQNTPNSWTHSDSTSVTIKSGETTQVSLGDNGAVLVGRIRMDVQTTNDAPLNYDGTLSGQMPQQPSFNSSEEAQAYYKSPEWQALMKLHKQYSIELKVDGSFSVDNVVPGVYSLNISARVGGSRRWEHPPMAQGNTSVTVPDSFSPTTPIDIGEVELKSTPQQN